MGLEIHNSRFLKMGHFQVSGDRSAPDENPILWDSGN